MKKLLFVSAVLIILGIASFAVIMTANGWDFKALGSHVLEDRTHEIAEGFDSILIDADTANIKFFPSEDGKCKVLCHDKIRAEHVVKVENGTLKIQIDDQRKWYDHINLFDSSPSITVYLPKSEYKTVDVSASTGSVNLPAGFSLENIYIVVSTGNVHLGASATGAAKIKASTGNVSILRAELGSLEVQVSTGRVDVDSTSVAGNVRIKRSTGDANITALTCTSLKLESSTGDSTLKDTVATGEIQLMLSTGDAKLTDTLAERFDIATSTGKVKFESSDAKTINVLTDTGSVKGTLRTPKLFVTKTDTGRINVPASEGSEPCIIETDTGNIEISIASS